MKHQCMNCEYCLIKEIKPYSYEYLCTYSENKLKEINPNDFCDNGKWDEPLYCDECGASLNEEDIKSEYEDYDTNELTCIFVCPNCKTTYQAKKDDDGYYDFKRYFVG